MTSHGSIFTKSGSEKYVKSKIFRMEVKKPGLASPAWCQVANPFGSFNFVSDIAPSEIGSISMTVEMGDEMRDPLLR